MNEIGEKLMEAVRYNRVSKVKQILTTYPDIVNYKDIDGWTALMNASNRDHIECVRALLQAGANPNIQDNDGDNALILAWVSKNLHTGGCVRLLLQAGAKPNLQGKDGNTVLIMASGRGHTECVRLLLKAGANPNLQNIYGLTALMYACIWGRVECVRLLLHAGANPTLKNKKNKTAYDLASNEDIKKLLLTAMNLWSLMPLYVQSHKKQIKLPTDLLRKTLEMMFSKKSKKINKKSKRK